MFLKALPVFRRSREVYRHGFCLFGPGAEPLKVAHSLHLVHFLPKLPTPSLALWLHLEKLFSIEYL